MLILKILLQTYMIVTQIQRFQIRKSSYILGENFDFVFRQIDVSQNAHQLSKVGRKLKKVFF